MPSGDTPRNRTIARPGEIAGSSTPFADMHPQHTAVFALTLASIVVSTVAKSTGPTENPFSSAEPTQTTVTPYTGSVQVPRVLKLLGLCSGDDQAFCLKGKCSYHPVLDRPTCSCPQDFTGERCEHMLLDIHSDYDRDKFIALGCGVALLFCSLIAVLYCCLKKRCEREKNLVRSSSRLLQSEPGTL